MDGLMRQWESEKKIGIRMGCEKERTMSSCCRQGWRNKQKKDVISKREIERPTNGSVISKGDRQVWVENYKI